MNAKSKLLTVDGCEAALAATISPKDAVTFKYKGWHWLSCLGKVPYFDSTYDLNYHHKLTDKLGLDMGAKLLSADYTMGNLSTCRRDDWQYTVSAGLGYAFNSHVSVGAAYALNLGRAVTDGPGVTDNQYDQQVVTLGAVFKF